MMETNAQGTFTYDLVPLGDPSTSIRLLELCPAPNFTDDLECRIYARPLGETGKYYALSYTWGENKKTHDISVINFPRESNYKTWMKSLLSCNRGRTCAKLGLPITASLDICLRHLRALGLSKGLTLTLWIDQICINQDSGDEKSHQVRLMKNIYSAADMVLAWLGPSADHSDEVMDMWSQMLETVAKEVQMRPSEDWNLTLDDSAQPWLIDLADNAVELYGRINSHHKLGKWQSRDWFSRVWIIQEFCLGDTIMLVCGDRVIDEIAVNLSLSIIGQACLTPAERFSKSPALANRAERWRDRYNEWARRSCPSLFQLNTLMDLRLTYVSSRRSSLLELLVELYIKNEYNFNTTRYRDRVYGLLGLASDVDELGIVPNYSGMSTAEVLIQVARAIVERGAPSSQLGSHPPLSVLRYAQSPKIEPEDMEKEVTNRVPLPTWVPDWGNNLTESYEGSHVVDRPYAPCGKSLKAEVVPTSNSNVLGLRGYLVDAIEERGHCSNPVDWMEFADSMESLWLMSYNKKPPVYPTALRHEESLWRTPIGDIMDGGRRAISTDIEEYRRLEQLERDVVQEVNTSRESHLKMSMVVGLRSGYKRRLQDMKGKRPYLTEKGYLGICPKHAEPGDLVVVFYGDRVAYVIRPAPEHGENRYTLVGEAYCDGIMDGEIADTAEKRDFFLV